MRIGTWNLDGEWSDRHAAVLTSLACDVLLLTECPGEAALPDHESHATTARIPGEKRQHWAAIRATQSVTPLPDPHPASASARIGDLTFCSSVLPWTLASAQWPWGPADHVGRVEEVLDALAETLGGGGTIWGGDWNQPLAGNISGFSQAAQESIAAALERHGLTVPTTQTSGRSTGQFSIDHVAVPRGWIVRGVGRIVVEHALSDHDAFWVDVSVPSGC